MKSAGKWAVLLMLLGLLGIFSVGCGPAPPCETSLVTLDETRLDAETYEQEAAETGKKVDELQSNVDAKQEQIDKIKEEPKKLEKKLHELKKGSGRE
jgi:peptidoglycan hydrolase CwlO-like protein